MELVAVESPLSGDFKRNKRYAKLCLLDCLLNQGEAPYASHLFYPQVLNDEDPGERKLGMEAGFAWATPATKRVVYTDLGISGGMEAGIAKAEELDQQVVYRTLPPDLMALLDSDEPIGSPTIAF